MQLGDWFGVDFFQTSTVIDTNNPEDQQEQDKSSKSIFIKQLCVGVRRRHFYLVSATAKNCFCTGWTLTQRRPLVSSECRDSWEFLLRKTWRRRLVLPHESNTKEHQQVVHITLVYVCQPWKLLQTSFLRLRWSSRVT